jgi:hypothetical protein
VIREEDEKMLKHIMDQIDRENDDEKRKRLQLKQSKLEMREYLNKQMNDKNDKQKEE